MADIDGAITEIVQTIRGNVSGLRNVPDNPNEIGDVTPMVIVFGGDGEYMEMPSTNMQGLHNLTIGLLVKRTTKRGVADALATLRGLQDEVPKSLFQAIKDGDIGEGAASSELSTFGNISYSYDMSVEYGGVEHVGIFYTIQDLKIQDALS